MDDEKKDAQEELDEEEDDGEDIDPKHLKDKGLHVEGEDETHDIDVGAIDPVLPPDPLLDINTPMSGEEDEEEVDLEDDEFSDKEEW